jgi:hypothetical protein
VIGNDMRALEPPACLLLRRVCPCFLAAQFFLGSAIGADLSGRQSPTALHPPPGRYETSWLGNSFSGASNRWVQDFVIGAQVRPDGTLNTWSHWDEGGHRFGVYRDGDVIGNQDVKANSLEVADKAGRRWKLVVEYVDPKHQEWDFVTKGIQCDGRDVTLPGLFQPTALALANDGQLKQKKEDHENFITRPF